jgi:hypothetical protein
MTESESAKLEKAERAKAQLKKQVEAVRERIGAIPATAQRQGMIWGPGLGKLSVAGLRHSALAMEEMATALPASEGQPLTAPVIDSAKMRELVELQFGDGSPLGDPPLRQSKFFDDTYYFLPTAALANQFFEDRRWLTDDLSYWAEVFDCDDFAYCTKTVFAVHRLRTAVPGERAAGIAAGIYWGGQDGGQGHVMNFVATTDQGFLMYDATPSARSGYPAGEIAASVLPVRYLVI